MTQLQLLKATRAKEDTKEERIKFEQHPSFRESLILKNGVATLKKDSGLTNDDIAAFRNKVISVNHQIHGIYDKIGEVFTRKPYNLTKTLDALRNAIAR